LEPPVTGPTHRYALITGAASGIGLEMARILAGRRYPLYLVDIDGEGLSTVRDELTRAHGIDVITVCMDLSLPSAADAMIGDVTARGLDVDVFISNAGFFFFGQIAHADPGAAARMIGLHVHTPSMLAIHFAREMKLKRRGHILITSSISAYKDFPGIGFYGASKSYLKSFGMSLRHELRYYGANVSVLCPGATATNLYDRNTIQVERARRAGMMMDAADVARAGIEGMFRGQAVIMPGILTRIMTYSSAVLPGGVIYWARVRWRRLLEPGKP
jgi:short-subunit dehydrogenase